MKCRYSGCRHESKDVNKDEAVKVGSCYYHKDCYEEKNTIDEVVRLFKTYIDTAPIYSQLRGIINKLISSGITADFLLFAVKYAIDNNFPISHAGGLYYLVKDLKIEAAWKKYNNRIINQIETPGLEPEPFGYTGTKRKSFENIFDGGIDGAVTNFISRYTG